MRVTLLVLLACGLANGAVTSGGEASAANPIRRVVSLLQSMAKKVAAEGEREKELYDKFMCYCKNSGGDLAKDISGNTAKVPALQSEIEEAEAAKKQAEADLTAHQEGRAENKKSIADATSLRKKEAEAFGKEKADLDANIGALSKAIPLIEKGMAGGFLQSSTGSVLRKMAASDADLSDYDRETLTSFLSGGSSDSYSPQSGQITGILKEMKDTFDKNLATATENENAAIGNFKALVAALQKEIAAHTAAVEKKTKQIGELAVSIVQMKNDLTDSEAALIEDKKFLANMDKNCAEKTAEMEGRKKVRAEEMLAIQETIKILNDDDALELFKKTLPSAAFLQLQSGREQVRDRVLRIVKGVQSTFRLHKTNMDFIALALEGKKVDFTKVIKMIDNLVALLGQEQQDDDNKQEYCQKALDAIEDKIKGLQRKISDLEASIADKEETLSNLKSEIKGLEASIKALDKAVAEATEQRKEENSEYKELMAGDSAAKELLNFAKNRLNKFYNPKLYKAPPKRELSEEERISVNMGGTLAPTAAPGGIAGTGVTAFIQIHLHNDDATAPPPPPETYGAYQKKGAESGGVIAMVDLLIKDLDKEMTEASTDEKNAQAEYEETMNDSAEKRNEDTKALADKQSAKADNEDQLTRDKTEKKSSGKEFLAAGQVQSNYHGECDWLLQNFDLRKEARASEVGSLKNAKAVLSGADFSFIQVSDAPMNLKSLKSELLNSKVFQDKVAQACKSAPGNSQCSAKAEDALFCQLLERSRPEVASATCRGPQKAIVSPALLLEVSARVERKAAPEDDLAKEMTHDLEMNFNKIAPFGKEDTAKELQDHAAKTQDTLVDAVENAEVAEIKRAVFRALTRLRAATIKEFDTIARLETQAIDAYNDAHHYRAENPLTHLHEDEAPVETDKLKSFH